MEGTNERKWKSQLNEWERERELAKRFQVDDIQKFHLPIMMMTTMTGEKERGRERLCRTE